MILRPATPQNSSQIADVYLSSVKTLLPFVSLSHSDNEVRSWISDILVPTGNVTVAEIDNRIIGMISVSTSDDISWINHLYLSPEFVGQGIGTKMLQKAMAKLPLPIRLYTFQQNTPAKAFYEKHGFQEISRSDGAGNEEKCPDILYEFSRK